MSTHLPPSYLHSYRLSPLRLTKFDYAFPFSLHFTPSSPYHIRQNKARINKKFICTCLTVSNAVLITGTTPSKPTLVAIKGTIFDVSGNKAYAPGGGYHGMSKTFSSALPVSLFEHRFLLVYLVCVCFRKVMIHALPLGLALLEAVTDQCLLRREETNLTSLASLRVLPCFFSLHLQFSVKQAMHY